MHIEEPLKAVQSHATVKLFKNKPSRRKSAQQVAGIEGTTQAKVVMAIFTKARGQWSVPSSVEKHKYTKKLKCNFHS